METKNNFEIFKAEEQTRVALEDIFRENNLSYNINECGVIYEDGKDYVKCKKYYQLIFHRDGAIGWGQMRYITSFNYYSTHESQRENRKIDLSGIPIPTLLDIIRDMVSKSIDREQISLKLYLCMQTDLIDVYHNILCLDIFETDLRFSNLIAEYHERLSNHNKLLKVFGRETLNKVIGLLINTSH